MKTAFIRLKQVDELREYEGPWKNLVFFKDGSCDFGLLIHQTKEAAATRAREFERQTSGVDSSYWFQGVQRAHWRKDYLFTIQVPIK